MGFPAGQSRSGVQYGIADTGAVIILLKEIEYGK